MIDDFPVAIAVTGEVIRTVWRMRIMHQENFLSASIAIPRQQGIKFYSINGMVFRNRFST